MNSVCRNEVLERREQGNLGQTGLARFCAGWLGILSTEQGRVFLLAWHGQLHTSAIFNLLNFESR